MTRFYDDGYRMFYPIRLLKHIFPSGFYSVERITDFENLIEWNGFLVEV